MSDRNDRRRHDEIARLTRVARKLRRHLADADEEVRRLDEENAELWSAVEDLKSRNAVLAEQNSELRAKERRQS